MPGEFLRVSGGNAAGTQIPVGNELLIGRAASGAGTLGDDPEISRNHARISYGPGGQLQIEDLGSTNGTYVNSRRIGAATPLKPGDTVQMGKSTLQVLDASGRAPQATAFGTAPPAAAAPPPPPPPPVAPGGYGAGPQAPPTAPLGAPVAGGPVRPVGQPSGGGGNKALLAVLGTLLGIAAIVGILFAAGVIGGDDDEPKKASNTTGTTAADGGDDEKNVRDTISTYLEDNDCRTLTDSYLSELFNQAPSNAKQACAQAVSDAKGLSPSDYTIDNVSVSGTSATADVEASGGSQATYKLVKEGDDWKIDSIRGEVSGAMAAENATTTQMSEGTTTENDPQAENKLEAEATLIAFIKAVRKSDEQVVCGLLTPRQAQRLVGGPGGDAAIVRCLEVLKGRDLSDIAKRGLAVSGVVIRGNQASVRLNDGTRVTLVKRDGQYRIDRGFG